MTGIKNYRIFAMALLAITVAGATTSAHEQYTVLFNFGNVAGDAVNPLGVLAQGRQGNLYSTSQSGGAPFWGAVFKITPGGNEKVLYSFCSQTNCADGNTPVSGLTLRPDGHFLGTTPFNGSGIGQGSGTIFDISPTGGLTTLYSFTGGTDGASPQASPILGPDGQFYGVAVSAGGPTGCGTIYRLSAVFTVLHSFDKVHGCSPSSALVLGTDGSFYGTTSAGGTANTGVVFRLTYRPGKATLFSVLANFDSTTGPPIGPLVEGSDGNFYGVTNGIINKTFGSVFKVTSGGVVTILHTLNGTTDGAYPGAGLTLASDGNSYGTARRGGASLAGTLFQITPAGSFSVLHNFDRSGNPPTNTIQHTNGQLYGVTSYGGTGSACSGTVGCGVVYSWDGGLPAFVSTVPDRGTVGSFVEILGQGFTSSTTVSFNGTPATATVVLGTYIKAFVPSGATTGFVTVTTSSGTLTSNKKFIVSP